MFSIVLLGLVGILSVVFGGMVLVHGGKSTPTRWFTVAIVSNGLWAIGLAVFLMLSPDQSEAALVVARSYYIIAALIATAMLLLVLTLGRKKRSTHLQIAIALPWILLSSALIFFSEFFMEGAIYHETQHHIALADGYVAYVIFFVLYYIATIVTVFVRRRREKSRLLKMQLASIAYAYIVAGMLGVVFDLFLPATGNYSLIWIGPLGTFAFIPIIYTAIVRQGLFDIRTALTRSIAYTLTLLVLAAVYTLLAYLASLIFVSQGLELSPISIALASLLALLFQPIKHFFDQLTNKLFYRGEYDQEAFLREFGKLLSYDTDLQLLLKQVSTFIAKNLNAESVFFYMQDKGIYGRTGTRKLQLPGSDVMAITRYREKISSHARVIVTERIESKDMRQLLLGHRIHLTLPLLLQGQVVGYLFVGEHKSRGYTARDMKMLESVANELTIAVQNSLSVEEIRELNESLQHRVDEATRELRESNKQLQRLDEAKDEFISMASHQLRTPLTSIKGYLDMLLEGDFGKTNATQRAVLTEAFMSSERMVGLINDFLNVSRIQTGKFILEKREVDLGAVVEEQARALEVIAKQYELQLEVKISSSVPHVSIDTEKIRQVVMNMLDNAVYYSRPNSVIKVRLTKEKSDVVFKVKDTGIGVPKAEQSQLFGKFFRASNARKRRPDGTGVGLFLSKKVIGVHGGEVLFESTEGKGSVFGFRLPIR